LFPAFLAGVIGAFGLSWPAIKLAMATLGLVGAWLTWRYFRAEPEGLAVTAAVAASPIYFVFSHHPMAEVPFFILVMAVLLALRGARTVAHAFLAGLLAAVAFLTRGYAALFMPVALVWFAVQRKVRWGQRAWRFVAFALPLGMAVLGWKHYTNAVIASQQIDFVTGMWGNAGTINNLSALSLGDVARRLYWFELRHPAYYFLPWAGLAAIFKSDLWLVLSLLFLAAALVGWWLKVRRDAGPGELWFPAMLGFWLFVNIGHSVRYWLVLAPFLFYYVFVAAQRFSPRLGRVTMVAVLASVTAGLVLHLAQPDTLRFATPHWQAYRDAALWAREHLPPDAVMVAYSSHKMYAVADRPTWPATGEDPIERVRQAGHAYVLCGEGMDVPKDHALWCRMAMADGRIKRVYGDVGLGIYRIERTTSARP